MTDDRVAWLTAQLDDDERVARAAADCGPEWRFSEGAIYPSDVDRHPGALIHGGYDYLDDQYGEHIARHDPARVLRRVAAGRKILAKYQGALMQEPKRPDDQVNRGYLIAMSQAVSALTTEYDDRPGYQEGWRV
ncbi:DUF6221 family protein [Micromonospora sp. MED01]|uniref:DUF6221 family protein n=1 Tax=Micromonospora alfalfae TaxID=2911212 RepID=UPI001EE856C6|nr:DUF6221 family protein [Micromonospora alfalfae]MCG5464206.1 DUF6221 family protein [Micromonospora alfalfae]